MSKKKNTLKDLDEFLKQQAATLVTPTPLSAKADATLPPAPFVEEPVAKEETLEKPSASTSSAKADVSLDKILEDLEALAQKEGTTFKTKVYDLILQAADGGQSSLPEDKMLINTVLYLQNGPQWKDAIRNYWRTKG